MAVAVRSVTRAVRRLCNWQEYMPERHFALLMVAPALVFLGLTIIYPLGYALFLSFHSVKFVGGHPVYLLLGLRNYAQVLADPRAITSLYQTLVFTVVRVSATMAIGFGISLVIHHGTWGSELYKRLFIIPWALSNVVNALMWKWMLSGDYGVLNEILARLHLISSYRSWLTDPGMAMPAVLFADTWKSVPFVALMLLAGLQGIPTELYDAARVDGAGPWVCFRTVTLPSLRPVLLVVLVIQSMWALRVFDIIWVLTQGGPIDRTLVLSIYAYEQAFRNFNLGYGSTVSYLITVVTFALTLAYLKMIGKEG